MLKRTLGQVFVTLLFSTAVAEPELASFILQQAEAPAQIESFSFRYQEGGTYTRDGVRVSAEYKNNSGDELAALQLSFVMFDPFNDQLTVQGGVDMLPGENLRPGDTTNGMWTFSYYTDWSTTTTVAYVSAARFNDSTVWTANTTNIAQQIEQLIGSEFKPESLEQDRE